MTCSRKVRSSAAVMFGGVVLASVLTARCQSTFAQDANAHAGQRALARAELVHAQVRVVAIDAATNSVTLRGPKHQQVLRAAKRISLDQLEVGDSVRAEFVSAAAVELVRE